MRALSSLLVPALLALSSCGRADLAPSALTALQDVAPVTPLAVDPTGDYYMVLFGFQSTPTATPANPRRFTRELENPSRADTHTFAAFIDARTGSVQTISWLPTRIHRPGELLDVRPIGSDPEPGENFSLFESLRFGQRLPGRDRTLLRWGPYKITPDFYARAKARRMFLERYKLARDPAQHDWLGHELLPVVRNSYIAVDNGLHEQAYLNQLADFSSLSARGPDAAFYASFAALLQRSAQDDRASGNRIDSYKSSALNCIHAVNGIDGMLRTFTESGYLATVHTLAFFLRPSALERNFIAWRYDSERNDILPLLDAQVERERQARIASLARDFGIVNPDLPAITVGSVPLGRLAWGGVLTGYLSTTP